MQAASLSGPSGNEHDPNGDGGFILFGPKAGLWPADGPINKISPLLQGGG